MMSTEILSSDAFQLAEAFDELRENLWYAEANIGCCTSCGWEDVRRAANAIISEHQCDCCKGPLELDDPLELFEGVAFWNVQSHESAFGQSTHQLVKLRNSDSWVEPDADWSDHYWDENVEFVDQVYGDTLVDDLYIQWAGDIGTLVYTLRKHGLDVDFPENENTTVVVRPRHQEKEGKK